MLRHAGGVAAGHRRRRAPGKTSVLRERFARLIEDGADPERVALVVGLGRARATPPRRRCCGGCPRRCPGLQVVTFHGLANRILQGAARRPRLRRAAADPARRAEQFAKVQELLADAGPRRLARVRAAAGPARVRRRGAPVPARARRRRCARPRRSTAAAERRGLTGWHELARFLGEYQAVIDDLNVVDFAALLQRAARWPATASRCSTTCSSTTTRTPRSRPRRSCAGLRAPDLVVAADPDAHVFSFQGMSRRAARSVHRARSPARRSSTLDDHRIARPSRPRSRPGSRRTPPRSTRRSPANSAGSTSRRASTWADLAVVVRRQGAHLGGLLRALDDARIPRAVPERGLSLTAEPATRPYVLALRWLVADEPQREELSSSCSRPTWSGSRRPPRAGCCARRAPRTGSTARRARRSPRGSRPTRPTGSTPAREALAKASLFAGMSVQDAFRTLWEELPCSRRLVDAADRRRRGAPGARHRRDVRERRRRDRRAAATRAWQAFLESLDAGEHGPGHSAWERSRTDAVQVLTAHGAVGPRVRHGPRGRRGRRATSPA